MLETRPAGVRPFRSVIAVALLLLIGVMLGGCQKGTSRPPLTDLDLARAITTSWGISVPDAALLRVTKGDSTSCVDFHWSERTFVRHASTMRAIDVLAMRLKIRGGYTGWRPPKDGGREDSRVASTLEHALSRASARAIVRISAEAAGDQPHKPWPKTCKTTFWFAEPVYVDDVAFVDTGSTCGGLCGSGSVYAFEYRDRRWSLVATAPTWIA